MADTDLIERLKFHGRYASETQAECTERKNAEREEAATALAEKDARIAELEAAVAVQRESKEYAQRCCITAESALTASRAECEGLRAALSEAQKTMRNCQGAIESNQVEDKDVRRQLIRGRSAIDAALSRKETGDAT